MNLNELYPFAEDRKSRKRVGRGSGSGLGCTSGKGNKGQTPALAAVSAPALKAARCPCSVVFPSTASRTSPSR